MNIDDHRILENLKLLSDGYQLSEKNEILSSSDIVSFCIVNQKELLGKKVYFRHLGKLKKVTSFTYSSQKLILESAV